MNESKDGSRKYDAANPAALAKFMKTGWAPTPLEGIVPSEAIPFCKVRIEKLSKKYPGKRVIIPAGWPLRTPGVNRPVCTFSQSPQTA